MNDSMSSRERIRTIIKELGIHATHAMNEIAEIAAHEAEQHVGDKADDWNLLGELDVTDASVQINRALRALLAGFEWRNIEDR